MHLAQQRAVENKIRCHQLVDHVVLSPIDGLLQEAADDCFVCFSSHASTPNATIYLSTGTRAKPAESKSINLRSGRGGRTVVTIKAVAATAVTRLALPTVLKGSR